MRRCLRCGKTIKSFSAMRKWCVDCRKIIQLEQARKRKVLLKEKRKLENEVQEVEIISKLK